MLSEFNQTLAVGVEDRAGKNVDPLNMRARRVAKGAIQRFQIRDRLGANLHPHLSGNSRRRFERGIPADGRGIEHRQFAETRHKLPQQIETLRAELLVGEREAGRASAGMGEAFDEACRYRIARGKKHNRSRWRRAPHGVDEKGSDGDDHVRLRGDEFCY